MKKKYLKYIIPLVIINVKPIVIILFLSLILNVILIKSSKIHIAQGLNPSIKPSIIPTKVRLVFFTSILPSIGIVLSCVSFLMLFSSFK